MSNFRKILSNYLISSALFWTKTEVLLRRDIKQMAMSSTDYSMAYVTAPDTQVAKSIAQKLVESKLCACVNIIPSIISIYRWKDNIENDSEVLMILKTRTSRVDEVIAFVKSNHPYDVCEVISVPIQNGNEDYLKWLGESVPEK